MKDVLRVMFECCLSVVLRLFEVVEVVLRNILRCLSVVLRVF